MDTLFHKAQTLFRSDKGFETRRASVLVKGGKIARVEEDGPACDRLKESFSGRIIDGRDRLLVPALFNCHTHSYMSILRNCADDLPFDKWLFGAVMPAEDRMTPDEAFTGAALAMVEMVKSGCGCFSDMHMHPGMTADAALYVGMRGVISRGVMRVRSPLPMRRRIASRVTSKLTPRASSSFDATLSVSLVSASSRCSLPI